MAERKGQVFDDFSGRLSCSCDGFGESESKKPEHIFLQISRQQFGVDWLIILKFIALRMEMHGQFFLLPTSAKLDKMLL